MIKPPFIIKPSNKLSGKSIDPKLKWFSPRLLDVTIGHLLGDQSIHMSSVGNYYIKFSQASVKGEEYKRLYYESVRDKYTHFLTPKDTYYHAPTGTFTFTTAVSPQCRDLYGKFYKNGVKVLPVDLYDLLTQIG